MFRFLSRALIYGASFSAGLELGEAIRRRAAQRRRASEEYRMELAARACNLAVELALLDAELESLAGQP